MQKVTGHFAQKTFQTSLLAQVLDCLHNSLWSFHTKIISEKHQYKRITVNSPMVQLADANSPTPTHRRIKSSRCRRVGPQSNTTY